MQIVMEHCVVRVVPGPDNIKVLHVQDQQGNVVVVPMPPEAARTIGLALSSSVLVASQPIPEMVH